MSTLEEFQTVIRYEPSTGEFFWTRDRCRGIRAGDKAGHTRKRTGYVMMKIFGKQYQGHRLAWFFIHGYWPENQIDHKDRDRSNNAIDNLREATISQNSMNTGLKQQNTSGYRGVTWNRSVGKWQAQAKIQGKNNYLGIFSTAEEASFAYEAFRAVHHGEFHAGMHRVAA